MDSCIRCGMSKEQHETPFSEGDPAACAAWIDEPGDDYYANRSGVEGGIAYHTVDSFEGIGDFASDDPYERYIAHRAAKG